MAPSKEYLLLLAQPAIKIPITDTEETAVMNSIPILISQIWKFFANINGARTTMETIITINGARLNRNLSTLSGVIPSFTISFNVSATVWNIPPGPTRLGPNLTCIQAETFLSIRIKTKPKTANSPITQTAMIINSMSLAMVGSNSLYNQLSIKCDMFSKLQPIPSHLV